MGVPAFFRWLTKKYPSIVIECIDEMDCDGNPIDTTQPNPNGVEFDNLYLDMNGIIHPCTHPENKPAPKNEDEMMVAIFECIDRMFSIVRPRKLLYMAIDGVAPRAKMNQQRSRRFRASKEAYEKITEVTRIKEEMREKGMTLPPEKERGEYFDSNCITPGTPFMARLSTCLNYYVHDRLNKDPGWKGIKVILSDANVPGEGEHKIMAYIRKQRAQPDHDPNTQHCLCGADADLIMLGLATHEPNFTIIREEFNYNQLEKPCDICGQKGHEMKECRGLENEEIPTGPPPLSFKQNYIFVKLSTLREYLTHELTVESVPEYNFERALDDWVCMCFFVGNDFLPHLPSLEIREGAIDRLINIYKSTVEHPDDYLTDSGDINLNRVQIIMEKLGEMEDEIFERRRRNEIMFRQRNKERKLQEKLNKDPLGNMDIESDEEDEPEDTIKLHEPGYKERYYELKFSAIDNDNFIAAKESSNEYTIGLCWVLKYYYQGCVSWKWYYPHHYAPFASDFKGVDHQEVLFEEDTEPFLPLEQLMGVFPAASRSHVPEPYAQLMIDQKSPIKDFYPKDFLIDLNGKRFAWQGVAILPFVDEVRLKNALRPFDGFLTSEECERNKIGSDKIYVNEGTECFNLISDIRLTNGTSVCSNVLSEGMRGIIRSKDGTFYQGLILNSPVAGLPQITNNEVLCASFSDPVYVSSYKFSATVLKGAIMPEKVLKPHDFPKGHRRGGSDYCYRGRGGFGGPRRGGTTPEVLNRAIRFHAGNRNNPRQEVYLRPSVMTPLGGSSGGHYHNQSGGYAGGRGGYVGGRVIERGGGPSHGGGLRGRGGRRGAVGGRGGPGYNPFSVPSERNRQPERANHSLRGPHHNKPDLNVDPRPGGIRSLAGWQLQGRRGSRH